MKCDQIWPTCQYHESFNYKSKFRYEQLTLWSLRKKLTSLLRKRARALSAKGRRSQWRKLQPCAHLTGRLEQKLKKRYLKIPLPLFKQLTQPNQPTKFILRWTSNAPKNDIALSRTGPCEPTPPIYSGSQWNKKALSQSSLKNPSRIPIIGSPKWTNWALVPTRLKEQYRRATN